MNLKILVGTKVKLIEVETTGCALIIDDLPPCHCLPKEGELFELSLLGDQNSKCIIRVVNIRTRRNNSKYAIVLGCSFDTSSRSYIEREQRYQIDSAYQIQVYGNDPYKFNQRVYYKIRDFSASGMSLISSEIEYLLLPNTRIKLTIAIPGCGEYCVASHIINSRFINKSKSSYYMGVSFVDPDAKFLEAISIYLLRHPGENITLNALKESNFIVPFNLTKVTKCVYVRSKKDYSEYLELRLKAQQAEGRWLDEEDPNNTIDSFDEKSRKFMFKIGSQVVAVGRLVFNEHHTEAEHASLVDLPEYIKKSSFIEASRFCNPSRI